MKKLPPSNFFDRATSALDKPCPNIELNAPPDSCGISLYAVIPDKSVRRRRKNVGQERSMPRGPLPRDLEEYVHLLRLADKLYRRAENSSRSRCMVGLRALTRGRSVTTPRTLHGEAEVAYERALELLEQLVERGAGQVLPWLDRSVVFSRSCDFSPSPDPEGVPRVVTVRSKYRREMM